MKKRLHFIYKITAALLCLCILAGIAVYAVNQRILNISYESTLTPESKEVVDNPYRGFYHLYGFTLTDDNTDKARVWANNILDKDDKQLVLLQINLKNFSEKNLSNKAIQQLDTLLYLFSKRDKQLVLRFLYDWDGKGADSEPDNIEMIAKHMKQASKTVNKYKKNVFIIQGLGTGNCGEMTGTNYSDEGEITYLCDNMAAVFDPSIFLAVRTPAHLRAIMKTHVPMAFATPYSGVLAARLGLYNDGMLGSVYDLGTYDDTSLEQSSSLLDKGTRSEELKFQNTLCQFVPNGGEVTVDNPYNDIDNAVKDLNTMHVTYINRDHDLAVMKKWENSTYNDMNALDYIEAHLGYRYVVGDFNIKFNSFLDNSANMQFTISNTGFAPAYRQFKTTLLLEHEENRTVSAVDIVLDNRGILNGNSTTLSVNIPVRDYEKGHYTIYLSMVDVATSLPITMANEGAKDTLKLGTLTIK